MARSNSPGVSTSAVPPEGSRVYLFSKQKTDGSAKMKNLLGGKGANLAEMCALGIPVPPGFTLPTAVCTEFLDNGGKLPAWVQPEVRSAISQLEEWTQKKFGSPDQPLLLSVRSGARASMPGMMDTILNLGLNEVVTEGLAKKSGNPRFAWDSYRRFLQMYSDVVMGMNASLLEVTLEDLKEARGVKSDADLSADDLKALAIKFHHMIESTLGRPFPKDPWDQLWGAISAVFHSWNTPRAVTYRQLHEIPASWGTAVNVQAMVFGNWGKDSATGVAFTRDPSTGEKKFFGEFLVNAQGEDVVAGIRTPRPISELAHEFPKAFAELTSIYQKLEAHYRDMQDIEFTIEMGKLWMLQTRNGKRTARASLRINHDMVAEGLISESEALLRLDPLSLDQLLHPTLDPNAKRNRIAKGLPASPGAVSGSIVFTPEAAVAAKEEGRRVLLVRTETSPEDIAGMVAAQGILTTRGGMTSHAAVVARGMGKCCVAGCAELDVDLASQTLRVGNQVFRAGEILTLDGSTGEVFLGSVAVVAPVLSEDFHQMMKAADRVRHLRVRANAETALDARVAKSFGAEGIGLCRTEHMFFGKDRIDVVREMILADTGEERARALARLLPMQQADFQELFSIMQGLPVTIRLLDPPLHEFVPHSDAEVLEFAQRSKMDLRVLQSRLRILHESNPMLGHRGCRLAITFPEIYQMQARAIALAVLATPQGVIPEIMLPLIATEAELSILRELVEQSVLQVQRESGKSFDFKVGTMMELPRAILVADRLAEHADFFSFGTNDLTQTTLGLSRDDSGRFLGSYVSQGIFPRDPFVSIDQEGVGALVKMGVDLGRRTKPDLKVGVCGEHGGDPDSIQFFHAAGLNYVSCSPYRIPIARLAAAQASLRQSRSGIGISATVGDSKLSGRD